MIAQPSWRQLAAIPESLLKVQILHACGIEPPLEGVSHTWQDDRLRLTFHPAGSGGGEDVWTLYASPKFPLGSRAYIDGSDALEATGTKAGTPTGDAMRAWMRRWGWAPRKERPVVDPTKDTRTII